MSNQETTIPENCCAKCGFMYAVTIGNIEEGLGVFDPDVLRGEDFRVTTDLTPMPVISNTTRRRSGTVDWYQIQEIVFVGCLHNIQPKNRSFSPNDKIEEKVEKILLLIREDRSNTCNQFFFKYHPGFSAKEHAEIRMQKKSEEAQRQHEIILADNQRKFEERFQRSEQRLTAIFGCVGATIGFLGLCGLCIGIPTALIELATAILNIVRP